MKTKQKLVTFLLILPMITILAGCSGSIPVETDQPSSPPGSEVKTMTPSPLPDDDLGEPIPDRKDRLPDETLPPVLDRVETPDEELVTGEVPDKLLEEIITDLIARTSSNRDSIQVIQAQSVIWNDGALGCPQPGMFYTQSLVEGYWVVLKIGEKEYDYHASQAGYFFLCEGRGNLPVSPPDDPGDRSFPKQ